MPLIQSDALKRIFDQDHVIRALWTFVVAFVFFLAGIWYNSTREPSRVVVTNPLAGSDTVLIRFDKGLPQDDKLTIYLAEVTRELKALRRQYASNPESYRAEKKSQLTLETSKIPDRGFQSSSPVIKVPIETVPVLAEINVPRFTLPAKVKGYLQSRLTALAKSSVSQTTLAPKANIEIVFELLDPKLVDKISPLIVTILQKTSENAYNWIADQQYVLKPGKNLVRFPADFGKGSFVLSSGFYFLSELDTEYPPLYRSQEAIFVQ
jgi:hypothetical protein